VYLRAKVEEENKEVKKNPTMKLSAIFIATMERVEEMLTNNLPIRDGEWKQGCCHHCRLTPHSVPGHTMRDVIHHSSGLFHIVHRGIALQR